MKKNGFYSASAFLFVFLFCGHSHAWFGPKTYDECIIDSMKGVTSNSAAVLIERACRNKFPASPQNQRQLPQSQLEKITGRATIGNGTLQGDIYNGTDAWVVTSVVVRLRRSYLSTGQSTGITRGGSVSIVDKYLAEAEAEGQRRFTIKTSVQPYSSRRFSINTMWKGQLDDTWVIEEAFGYVK